MKRPRSQQLTLAEAIAVTTEARCVTTATAPYTIVHTNRAWSELTGYKFTEAAGRTCSFLQGPATLREALSKLEEAIQNGKMIKTQLINYTRNGTPFINNIECSPVVGNTHFYATISGALITDGSIDPLPANMIPAQPYVPLPPEKFAGKHRGIRPSRTTAHVRLHEVLANTTDPIVLCEKTPPHVITHPNQPWLAMCGYSLEEVEGLTNKILTGPETDPTAIENLLNCVRCGEPSIQTLINYKKGGERFINQVKTLPVYNEEDDIVAFMSMLREIDPEMDNGAL